MASPFARVLAQIAVAGASIFSRAFVSAYQQAVHNARTGAQQSAQSLKRTSKMSTQEALQILNIGKTDMKTDIISQQYSKFFKANDPDKGGSFYLQSKVVRARESLDELLELQAKEKHQQEEKRQKSTKEAPPTG